MSDAPLAPGAQSIAVGHILREARLAASWTVSDVAKKLNLTANAVEFIESDQFDRLPGTTFTRGYIRSYAKILGLDATQLAKQFDQHVNSNNAMQSVVQSIDHVGEARRISRGMLQFSLFVVFLIVLSVAYYIWQSFNSVDANDSGQSAVFDRVEVERADGSVHIQTLDEPEDQALAFVLEENQSVGQGVLLEPETAEPRAADAPNTPVLPATIAAAAPVTPLIVDPSARQSESGDNAVKPAQENTALDVGIGAVQLNFVNDCWLRIVDADGKELMSGLKRAGEQLSVTGKAPLDVHLGYATGVSIIYNGEPVDFSSAIRGATARIKLGQ
ncbi:MAG: helix-turn-helix domain-containing protein [Pseudomonas sp.]|nr:helix-turn-helix domain-containing protein [Pseudomonas sp.]NLO53468.1 helix-turn-helix domain-containing protein [Gammaproteobacteria bacterium]